MDALVQTGQTRTRGEGALAAKSLVTEKGEQVFMLLQVEAEASAARNFQREVLNVIEHALLETEGEASERLDSTLKELNGLMKGLLLSKTINDVHAIIALAEESGMLHVSHAGRAEAYVVRGGTATQITEYTRGKPSPAFVHIASGQLEPRDTAVLSTQRLLRTLTPAQLANLAAKHHNLLEELKGALEAEKEQAAFAMIHIESGEEGKAAQSIKAALRARPHRNSGRAGAGALVSRGVSVLSSVARQTVDLAATLVQRGRPKKQGGVATFQRWWERFSADLQHPHRKRRAHILLLAGVVAVFLIVWSVINLASFGQRSQTKAELRALVEEVNQDIRTAENRRLTGEVEAANAILLRAEQRAKQVIDSESGYYRQEALEILARIQTKKEEINNIVRLSPSVAANLAAKNPAIIAQGFIGLADEEFIVYDRQDLYRVLHNSVEDPDRIGDAELILHGVEFPRYQTTVYQLTGNSVVEIIAGQLTTMKTEDPAGWITGEDMVAYLRFLYVLSPENNQIYKYERLSNRYTAPVEYNVSGDLSNAVDIAIDGNVYVLKEEGQIVKLLRGEVQPYTVRNAPDDALKSVAKIFKVLEGGHMYFLDSERSRVIIATDGGSSGEATYVRQFVLDGEGIGELQDLYVDPDETRLYVLDEKRIYRIDL